MDVRALWEGPCRNIPLPVILLSTQEVFCKYLLVDLKEKERVKKKRKKSGENNFMFQIELNLLLDILYYNETLVKFNTISS